MKYEKRATVRILKHKLVKISCFIDAMISHARISYLTSAYL